jgi:hypothetical protein
MQEGSPKTFHLLQQTKKQHGKQAQKKQDVVRGISLDANQKQPKGERDPQY